MNLSDRALKTNVRDLSEKELQETVEAVEPRMFDRIEGGKDQIGFMRCRPAGPWAKRCAKPRTWTAVSS